LFVLELQAMDGQVETRATTSGQAQPLLWLVTATTTGAIIMALELSAFRLYAPYFGYSIYVWGSMISVVMAALAGGYALGGWLADRSQSGTVLYLVILGSGVYQLVIIVAVRSILRWLWQSGEFFGTAVASLIIFVPTMTALAVTGPFVIRLLARAGHIGVTAGKVYALSTAGSIAGVLATSFFLVPRYGTKMTLQVCCAATFLVGSCGVFSRKTIAGAALLAAVGALLIPKPVFAPVVLWTTESAYNWIAVLHHEDLRWLVLNHPAYSQTTRKVGASWSGFYTDDFALGAALVSPRRMLALGMGAGGGIASTIAVAPEIEIDAVEIDPKVVEVAVKYFGLPVDRKNLFIHVADARPWLASHAQSYDLIQVDLYQGGPYIPFYLITGEFFEQVRSRMADDGLLMMNVYDTSKSHELLMATGATLKRVFSSVEVISRPDGNHMVLAFARSKTVGEVRERWGQMHGEQALQDLVRDAERAIVDLVPPEGTAVFTDDLAPVEEMTRRMLRTHQP
jgi:predicted membrane-bound spermidine synthase